MLILFAIYAGIVIVFAGIYLTASTLGQTTETNPDGSETVIPFCHMDVNTKMEALYVSLSTMAAIGYGGTLNVVCDILVFKCLLASLTRISVCD